MQIENLQFRHRCITAVHGPALVHQRVSEIVSPSLLQPLHFFQIASLLRGIRQFLGAMQRFTQLVFAVIHFLHVPGVPAEQVVLQVQPVLHHLEADPRGSLGHVDRTLRRSLGFMLALHRDQVDRQKHQNRRQNDAETDIQLFSDVHTPTFLSQRFRLATPLLGWIKTEFHNPG